MTIAWKLLVLMAVFLPGGILLAPAVWLGHLWRERRLSRASAAHAAALERPL